MNNFEQNIAVLTSLIRFDKPLATIREELDRIGWVQEPHVNLTLQDVRSVLERFIQGSISAKDLGEWADLLVFRDDVEFERIESESFGVGSIILYVANQEINGELSIDQAKERVNKIVEIERIRAQHKAGE